MISIGEVVALLESAEAFVSEGRDSPERGDPPDNQPPEDLGREHLATEVGRCGETGRSARGARRQGIDPVSTANRVELKESKDAACSIIRSRSPIPRIMFCVDVRCLQLVTTVERYLYSTL